MPWKGKRGGRRVRKSKPRFRKGRKGRKTVTVNRALQPVGQRYICKMKYAQTITTDANGRYTFRLNSIFNPDNTLLPGVGASHQPYGHDQLSLFYNRYRVIACGWRIQAVQTSSGVPIQLAAIPSNGAVIFVNVSEMKENPRSKYVTVSPGAASVYLRGKVSMPSLTGRTSAQYMADDSYQAVMGANPTETMTLNILTNTISDTSASFTCNVLLEYTVELFDPKNVGQS